MDDPLAQILEKFNRKERNLLIRDILGCPGEELCLSDDFCKRLESAVGISPKVPETCLVGYGLSF